MAALDEDGLMKVRRKMGYLFQSAALFDSFTLNENLALPLHRLDRNKSPEEIKRCGRRDLGRSWPGEGWQQDAVGSIRRYAEASRPGAGPGSSAEILLVDEPASGLDRITASEIDDLLMKVKTERHTTMVIVTHDIHGARKIADKFAVLDQGPAPGLRHTARTG
jgi:phospholipid/cholesterol/gamma-HCH transport system ATP-binding protein